MSTAAIKLALEALKDNQHLVADNERHAYVMEYNAIIEKLEEALANHCEDNLHMVKQERPQNCGTGYCSCIECVMDEQEQGELVAVKHMMEWVDYLKRKSDYGQFMQIPSGMSAGACWELAVELEQFINTTPPQRKPPTA